VLFTAIFIHEFSRDCNSSHVDSSCFQKSHLAYFTPQRALITATTVKGRGYHTSQPGSTMNARLSSLWSPAPKTVAAETAMANTLSANGQTGSVGEISVGAPTTVQLLKGSVILSAQVLVKRPHSYWNSGIGCRNYLNNSKPARSPLSRRWCYAKSGG
jgi:hypothetical protein